jgi:hypothetical protein
MKKKFIIKLMQTTPAMLAICLAGAFSANATTYDISANVGGADPSVYTTPVNLNTAQWNTWVKTGFNVIAGDTLVITAAGTWTIDNATQVPLGRQNQLPHGMGLLLAGTTQQ